MIEFESKGSFQNTEAFLNRMKHGDIVKVLEQYAQQGVAALASATPHKSGQTASSWYYTIGRKKGSYSITFANSHIVKGANVAILIQYGHGTRNGGYVQGRDYINPAIKPIFDKILTDVWKEVTK